ncbi:hypothetical protein TNIN_144391 [Trichonephila inaurata madagascariensis]|uniref:Uncharacterized protein n=1 Tax=Trichonephila inaurata madagascariensis TaxID=2747483 RepID=A0A8X6IDJ5_9ARAC|nr:hypothetical protein TNIN_144391 [Trichonephila inaurata madagascariensis]
MSSYLQTSEGPPTLTLCIQTCCIPGQLHLPYPAFRALSPPSNLRQNSSPVNCFESHPIEIKASSGSKRGLHLLQFSRLDKHRANVFYGNICVNSIIAIQRHVLLRYITRRVSER